MERCDNAVTRPRHHPMNHIIIVITNLMGVIHICRERDDSNNIHQSPPLVHLLFQPLRSVSLLLCTFFRKLYAHSA